MLIRVNPDWYKCQDKGKTQFTNIKPHSLLFWKNTEKITVFLKILKSGARLHFETSLIKYSKYSYKHIFAIEVKKWSEVKWKKFQDNLFSHNK